VPISMKITKTANCPTSHLHAPFINRKLIVVLAVLWSLWQER
jgi:hypothetical protein